ncbi:MAG: DMP19 family protein [Firmicutes bacterium]|nr:DMP19 family protein [Bacillota bacterium]
MNIKEIMQITDPADFGSEITEYLDDKTDYGDDLGVLNEYEATVFFMEELQMEVMNGGFDQYFFNSSGNNWRKAIVACKEIGADKIADLLVKATEIIGCELPEDEDTRQDNMNELTKEGYEDELDELDDIFYEDEEYIDELVYAYCKKHSDKFIY